jgi:protein TonB
VEFVVDEAGRVMHPFVVRSSRAGFEAPTLRAVEKWRFEPGKKDGRAVRFRMQIPVTFSLKT